MGNHRLPGWLGPIIGPFAGIAIAYHDGSKSGFLKASPPWEMVAAFGIAGLIGGLLIWWIDRHWLGHERAVNDLLSRLPPEGQGDGEARPPQP